MDENVRNKRAKHNQESPPMKVEEIICSESSPSELGSSPACSETHTAISHCGNDATMGDSGEIFSMNLDELKPALFSTMGMRLSFFNNFVDECGGRDVLAQLTTVQVCEHFVKPLTLSSQSSYCEFMSASPNSAVGEAMVFISHAWQYIFLDVLDALEQHFLDHPEKDPDPILWFDLFSNNQHKAVDYEFDWWCNTFKSAIEHFGHTVMVLAPWDNPIPLTRGWCLFEVYCTITTKSRFAIALSHVHQRQFLDDMAMHGERAIEKMLATIDAEKSQCFFASDRDSIFEVVRKTVGFKEINSIVLEALREWVITAATRAISQEADLLKRANLKSILATLYQGQGKYSLAKPLYIECVETKKSFLGDKDPDYLKSLKSLASLYKIDSNYELAQPIYTECMTSMREVLTDRHPEYLELLSEFAVLHSNKGALDLAEPLYKECLAAKREELGDRHPSTLTLMNDLAKLYTNLGHYSLAEPLFATCLETRKDVLGHRHPNTLVSLSCFAWLYDKQGRDKDAEPLHLECLATRKEVLGDRHPDYLKSLNVLGELYQRQGRLDLAESMHTECLNKRKELFDPENTQILISLNNLATTYTSQGRFEDAEPMFQECLSARRRKLGEKHMDYLKTLNNFAILHMKQGEYDLAKAMLEECVKTRATVLGVDHPDYVESLTSLAAVEEKISPAK